MLCVYLVSKRRKLDIQTSKIAYSQSCVAQCQAAATLLHTFVAEQAGYQLACIAGMYIGK